MNNFRLFLSTVIVFSLIVSIFHTTQAKPTNYKASDFKKDGLDLSGLNEEQTEEVIKLLNNNDCTCGCDFGSWANCIIRDKKCPYSRPTAVKVIKYVKEGKPEDFILGYFDGWKEGNARKRKKSKAGKKDDPNRIYSVTTMNAPVKGPEDAPVTLIEYTDYQCHFCMKVQPTIKELLMLYPDKIRFVTMNNPLSFHENAFPAALAARAAGKQEKFWEMHELLFENSGSLEEGVLLDFAMQLDLNIDQFNVDRQDEGLKEEIMEEQKQAVQNGATGTPAFFINGKKVSGAKPLESFIETVDDAIKRAGIK